MAVSPRIPDPDQCFLLTDRHHRWHLHACERCACQKRKPPFVGDCRYQPWTAERRLPVQDTTHSLAITDTHWFVLWRAYLKYCCQTRGTYSWIRFSDSLLWLVILICSFQPLWIYNFINVVIFYYDSCPFCCSVVSKAVFTLVLLPDARTVRERYASGCPCTHCVHCVGFVRYTQTTSRGVLSGRERYASG